MEKLYPTSRHIILQNMINDNSNDFHDPNTQEKETFLTYTSLPSMSNVMDKAIQTIPQTRVCKHFYYRGNFRIVHVYLFAYVFFFLHIRT